MDTVLITPLIEWLQSLPVLGISLLLFVTCLLSLLGLLRLLGAPGLYIYNMVAILAANIQVLKGVQLSSTEEPMALGTVVFATTYLCSDILTEHYGKDAATRGIWYCFAAQILMTLLMVLALGHPPLQPDTLNSASALSMLDTEKAMTLLFTPSPRLLLASLVAFIISQFNDVWVFQALSQWTQQKKLWLRTTLSTVWSAFVDTVIFSLLAWVVFSPTPVSGSVLWSTYIVGTFITRGIISLLSIPAIYFSYRCIPSRRSYVSQF